MSDDVSPQRVRWALAVTVAIVLAVPVADACAHAASGARGGDAAPSGGISASALMGRGSPDALLAGLEDAADAGDCAVPEYFEEEIGLLPGFREVRVDPSRSIVGYIVDGDSGEVFGALRDAMADRGWACVPLEGAEGATFLKEGGSCRWALATCTQVGDTTSVVFRCMAA